MPGVQGDGSADYPAGEVTLPGDGKDAASAEVVPGAGWGKEKRPVPTGVR
jgi:hypothetical protein